MCKSDLIVSCPVGNQSAFSMGLRHPWSFLALLCTMGTSYLWCCGLIAISLVLFCCFLRLFAPFTLLHSLNFWENKFSFILSGFLLILLPLFFLLPFIYFFFLCLLSLPSSQLLSPLLFSSFFFIFHLVWNFYSNFHYNHKVQRKEFT